MSQPRVQLDDTRGRLGGPHWSVAAMWVLIGLLALAAVGGLVHAQFKTQAFEVARLGYYDLMTRFVTAPDSEELSGLLLKYSGVNPEDPDLWTEFKKQHPDYTLSLAIEGDGVTVQASRSYLGGRLLIQSAYPADSR